MKKTLFGLILLLILHVFTVGAGAARLSNDMLIRVGLRYGDSAGASVNIYYDGGYDFGYFDGDDEFVTLWSCSERYISVIKDANFTFSSSSLSQGWSGNGRLVGAYHVQLDAGAATRDEAQSELEYLRDCGVVEPFVAWSDGKYVLRGDYFSSLDNASAACQSVADRCGYSARAVGAGANTLTVINMNTGEILFEYYDTASRALAVRPQGGGRSETMKNASSYYYGAFEFFRQGDGNITFINTLPVDDYLKGVVPYEMSNTWPNEALKAQAVAARNFVCTSLTRHSKDGFNVCSGQHCQAYGGAGRGNANSDGAVEDTSGVILTYNGKAAECYYHSSSGGWTENTENVWLNPIPYIVAVEAPYEDLDKAYNGRWTYTLTGDELKELFNSKGYSVSTIEQFYVDEFTPAGNVYRVVAIDSNGKKITLEKSYCRTGLSPYANSQRFTITGGGGSWVFINRATDRAGADGSFYAIDGSGEKTGIDNIGSASVITAAGQSRVSVEQGQSDGTFVINGAGWGNNIGMSQWSAKGMAEHGWTYDEILLHFFPGTRLETMDDVG